MKAAPKKIDIIVTLGPSLRSEYDLRLLKERGVSFVRLNMSHSSTADLRRAIKLAKKVGIPFIVDTEGSQVRTGPVEGKKVEFTTGDSVRIYRKTLTGSREAISLTPRTVLNKLLPGDLLYCDFDSLVLCIQDVSSRARKGYLTARVVSGGFLGSSKGVYIDTASGRSIELPPLTSKDLASIKIGLSEGVGFIAASYIRSAETVRTVRRASKGRMKVISKIERIEGLKCLDAIIAASDALLIDRGDLGKEILFTRVPLSQKLIVHRARRSGKPVIVATNFLESMVKNRRPTRAEIHDIESSITDGATGLTLAAETAIGVHPIACLNVMQQVIRHVTSAVDVDTYADKERKLVAYLEKQNYLLGFDKHSPLVAPHGGTLVNRILEKVPSASELARLPALQLSGKAQMDAEQVATGAYSPLEGFMDRRELVSVLKEMRLPNGLAWPLPVLLDVSEKEAKPLRLGSTILLRGEGRRPVALLHLKEKFSFNTRVLAQRLYGTTSDKHPGVRQVKSLKPVFLAGPIDLIERRPSETAFLELTPRQTRRFFEERGWSRVVGFHTRNVIHRSHEFIQLEALRRFFADGLFVHPVVGEKKPGDFKAQYIVKSYDLMMQRFYPRNRVLFSTWASYSRYAGPREALFTALVRQNYGCSHFIIGRDHTGVGNFYAPTAAHAIFDRFPELGIRPVRFGRVFYSTRLKKHVHEKDDPARHRPHEQRSISGTEARKLFGEGKTPPAWFMRKEVSGMVRAALKRGEKVFVE